MTRLTNLFRIASVGKISVDANSPIPTAGVTLTENGYILELGQLYREAIAKGDEEAAADIIAHELAHVFRGDCLRIPKEESEARLWNMACDIAINSIQMVKHIERYGVSGLCYELSAPILGLPEDFRPSTAVIFNALKRHKDEITQSFDQMKADGEQDALERAHAETILNARELVEEAVNEGIFPEILKDLTSGNDAAIPKTLPHVQLKPLPPAAIDAVKRLCERGMRGEMVRKRGWRREGRLEGLRGSWKEKRGKIVLAVDTSGSLWWCLPVLHGLWQQLSRRWRCQVILWSTGPYYDAPVPPTGNYVIGPGGTEFAKVPPLINKHSPDVAVVVTDGEIFDHWQPPACPVVWVTINSNIVKGGPIRVCDRIVKWEG